MRWIFLSLVLGQACVPQGLLQGPPRGNFYFPTGIAIVDDGSSAMGFLYVANSNFDRRYSSGSVLSVQLDRVGQTSGRRLPPIGMGSPGAPPLQLDDLGDTGQVIIQSFAGEMTKSMYGGGYRLFVPSRGDRNPLQIIQAVGTSMTCLDGSSDCDRSSPSLSALEQVGSGIPRLVEPLGVGVGLFSKSEPQVVVTQLKQADAPAGSGNLLQTFILSMPANDPRPVINADNFISLGLALFGNPYGATTNSVAVGGRFAYATNRYRGSGGALFYLVDGQTRTFADPGLEVGFRTLEARGIALNRAETRAYVAARAPDSLIIVSITATGGLPALRVLKMVPLPLGTAGVAVIERLGQGNLIAVSSSSSNSVSIYDEDLGSIAALIPGVGIQPFALAVQQRGNAARVFATCFGDGRVGVIDIADVRRPQQAQLVAFLGRAQTCLVQETDTSCGGQR
jgi:DNA-binding beta-propeller fold protein YncE